MLKKPKKSTKAHRSDLVVAMDLIRKRLSDLEYSNDPVDCVAEGTLEVAVYAISAAADLLCEN